MNEKANVVIVGTGVAGLYCALHLPSSCHVLLLTKSEPDKSDSYLAQGGMCALKDESDFNSFFTDTLKAGHYENDPEAVRQMIRRSPEIVRDLLRFGVAFEQKNGKLCYTREGAHSAPRILYHQDITGREITEKLWAQVREKQNLVLLDHTEMVDLVVNEGVCGGIIARRPDGTCVQLAADYTVLATGGIGGLFRDSTNYPHLTGDSLALALQYGIRLQNINYVQIHPTTLYSRKPGRRFLISESVRGEGAWLLNAKMERFADELLPRDLLTQKIRQQMQKEGSRHVWLSLRHLDRAAIRSRFPNIYKRCLEEGIDITCEPIPVVPAQHYFMGGIAVDLHSKTSMGHLYAAGETSCNGVHGANRLASNSLLESLVFAREAARDIAGTYRTLPACPAVDLSAYRDVQQLRDQHKRSVLEEIERVNRRAERNNMQIKCG